MAGREFPIRASNADSWEELRRDLNELILILSDHLRIEEENSVTTYESGWSDNSTDPVRFSKDPNNRVFIRGFADHVGPTPPAKIFTLPAGYRPGEKIIQWNDDHKLEVRTDGTVYFNSGTWGSSTNFTGINFFAEG
jgi:hypothetical protein